MSSLFYAAAVIFPVLLPAFGIALGQSRASKAALDALDEQPAARNEIVRALILGLALMETAGVMSVALAFLLLFDPAPNPTSALLGIPLALTSGLVLGYVSSWATEQACAAIARQPFLSQKIINLLLLTQSFMQTPFIFGFFIAWFVKTQAAQATTMLDCVRLLACGFVMGIGSIGPVIGLAQFARTVISSVGAHPNAYSSLMTFTLFSQAIIETPIIFAFVVALLMLFTPTAATDSVIRHVAFIAAAASTGFGIFGPGINSGRIASAACVQIAQHPERYTSIARASMFAQALIDTFVVYAALVSFMLILLVK